MSELRHREGQGAEKAGNEGSKEQAEHKDSEPAAAVTEVGT